MIAKILPSIIVIYAIIYDIKAGNRGKYTLFITIYFISDLYVYYNIPYTSLPLYWVTGIFSVIQNRYVFHHKLGMQVFVASLILSLYFALPGSKRFYAHHYSIPLFTIIGLIIGSKKNATLYTSIAIVVSSILVIVQNIWPYLPNGHIPGFLEGLRHLSTPHYRLGLAAGRMGILLTVGLRRSKTISMQILTAFGSAVCFAITFASGARAQMIGLMVASIYGLRKDKKKIVIAVVVLTVLLLIGINYISMEKSINRYDNISTIKRMRESTEYSFRREQRAWGLQKILEKPIFGYGYRTWIETRSTENAASALYYSLGPHNSYILYVYQYGIMGILLIAFVAIKSLRVKINTEAKLLSIMILIMYLIVGIAHDVLANNYILWLYLGIINAKWTEKCNVSKGVWGTMRLKKRISK